MALKSCRSSATRTSMTSHFGGRIPRRRGLNKHQRSSIANRGQCDPFDDRKKLEAASCECYNTATDLVKAVIRPDFRAR
jgi:hypothetical protein